MPTSASASATGWPTSSNAAKAGEGVSDLLRGALEVLDDRDVASALETLIERRVRATPVAPLVGKAIDLAVEGGHHQRLLDAVLKGLGGFLDDNRTTFRERLEHESPWWIPESIDDRLFTKIYGAVHSFLADVGSDTDHEVRRSIDARVVAFAERLRSDPELLAKGEELKTELLAHPDVRAWLGSLWGEVKRNTVGALDDPASELRQRLTRRWRRSDDGWPTRPNCRPRSTIGSCVPPATSSITTRARSPT